MPTLGERLLGNIWYIVFVPIALLICSTLILVVKMYYKSACHNIETHRKRFISRLQESDTQMSKLIEMTAQYLDNVCRIGAYVKADKEWRDQQEESMLRSRLSSGSRPSSVGGAYSSIYHYENDDQLAKKYNMQDIIPRAASASTLTRRRTNSMREIRSRIVSSYCDQELYGEMSNTCRDDFCPNHGERNRALTNLNPDVGLHGNYGAPDQLYPISPTSQMSVFSYSLPRPPRE